MPYELSIYKSKLFDGFVEWVEKYQDDPLRQDAYMRASRIHTLLEAITPESDNVSCPEKLCHPGVYRGSGNKMSNGKLLQSML